MTFTKTEGEDIIEDQTPIEPEEIKPEETAEDAFAAFERNTSNIAPKIENISLNSDISIEDSLKVSMLLSFGCYLLSGFHAFLFSKMAGIEITTDELLLTDKEKNVIEPLMKDNKIIEWLNSLHPAFWVVMQIEYIYYMKFRTIKKLHELKLKEKV
jgi:hypothetical protein